MQENWCNSLSVRTVYFLSAGLAAGLMVLLATTASMAQSVAVPVKRPDPSAEVTTDIDSEEQTPAVEPERVYQAACPALLEGRIKGKPLPPIEDGGCGENSPLEITAIGEVQLTTPVTMNCRMAETLHGWVDGADQSALVLLKSQLWRLNVSTSYQCRRRNNAPDGKISEHGFANALDIAGFELVDGTRISVLDHWPAVDYEAEVEAASEEGEAEESTYDGPEATLEGFLRLVHQDACTRFTTVLGPEANVHHADHFHFDLGCHGKTCTYRICE